MGINEAFSWLYPSQKPIVVAIHVYNIECNSANGITGKVWSGHKPRINVPPAIYLINKTHCWVAWLSCSFHSLQCFIFWVFSHSKIIIYILKICK